MYEKIYYTVGTTETHVPDEIIYPNVVNNEYEESGTENEEYIPDDEIKVLNETANDTQISYNDYYAYVGNALASINIILLYIIFAFGIILGIFVFKLLTERWHT